MYEISVVMSVYNAEEYLKQCIDSILMQSFTNFEFIIVDDGSADNSNAIISGYDDPRIKLIAQTNQGLCKALNTGIKSSQGKYIARMDADDIAMKDRLQKQFDFLEKNQSYVAVGSNAEIIDTAGETLYTSSNHTNWEEIKKRLPRCSFFHSAVMFRKETFLAVGGYNEDIRHHIEDAILWNQFSRHGQLANLQEALIQYRIVPSAISNRSVKQTFELNRIIKTFCEKGCFEEEDMARLRSITRSRSARWKKSNYYQRIGKIFIERNFDKKKAFYNLACSIWYNPGNLKSYFNIGLLALPFPLINKWKKLRLQTN